ncbi:MAG: UDP-N-acetylmuramoyl-L-alanyl-D-glutamate--2,6-diaminopimelate ligase, partial [Candidatus Dadabacteria bacterium]|nr:UDP-N-acetylmuramoyl-L-alanyl-D-glutamate--2,6-diaminopimelate ligase [Candidatus Dadabacteria bacterium]NIS09874.1 UDP-N-acetylmuramoyl-L-alanyl-D-glutamate--2,6-diaminopimelate ligase [Candidatus Dadabacteria bacterium]NIV41642.1 UDP-N-acetylmuramoyl-L-alanyl-D-glutamate--2,6-diaminopimelate ligase [Candidatus Dadabacteria bacterium]NIX16301.1 UDP-N-acetylmuramoyl-L-alanyl-D-glutamate--2,6-diaminopimelate ligase [Candidatus Dadabacteria bacterium]NIY22904.1 UDP-N-acetylmuramoyl-L-alanyl-D-
AEDTSKIQNTEAATVVKVKDTLDALAYISSKFYGEPTKDITVTAVTGTNGKTTITYLIESICTGENQIVGVIGTINYRYKNRQYPSSLTTPLSKELQQLFKEMKESGVQNIVAEASSHALDKKRLDYSNIDCAVFTNLTQDHLDYHKDFDSYFQAKKRLFSNVLNNSNKDNKVAVSNYDDPYGEKIVEDFKGTKLLYSVENPNADVYAKAAKLSTDGIKAKAVVPGAEIKINSRLLGRHNLSNILASVACAVGLGISKDAIEKGIASLINVPGRLERINNDKGINIFVDYAHTPDALGNVLRSVKSLCEGRLIAVFGCGGDRDREKRPMMGSIAAGLADMVIVTSDNPRSEDPEKIIVDIEKGIKETGLEKSKYIMITDRYEAILKSVQISKEKDTIIVAGKGHEDYQIIGDKTIHFDDREACRKALEESGRSKV